MTAERIGWMRGRRARMRSLALVALLAGVAASMVGCGGPGASTGATPPATPTATATPAPQTLYQA
ncbi:MAG: hypothetical protein KGO05_07815, partial [Chloroflexota bacterium]|nr:hypothetical protein [Chloroflexota bacterium]